MQPPPIHRSRLAWLALPGLIFLLWAWLNDPAYYNFAGITLGDHTLMLLDDGGLATIDLHIYPPGQWTAPGFFHDRWQNEGLTGFLPPAFRFENKTTPYHTGFSLHLSYWLLTLLYLATLTATHLGWSRRHARLATTATAAIPTS